MDRKRPENLVAKIQSTKQDTEKLKKELEALIHSNIEPPEKKVELEPKLNRYYLCPWINNVKAVPENLLLKQPAEVKTNQSTCSKKSNRDVKETREYIRKQREKRSQEVKTQKNESAITAAMRKEKLQELHKKSLELVKQNLQQKRERSKSREPPLRSRSPSTKRPVDLNKAIIADHVFNVRSKSSEPPLRSRSPSTKGPVDLNKAMIVDCPVDLNEAVIAKPGRSRSVDSRRLRKTGSGLDVISSRLTSAEGSKSVKNPNLLYPEVHVWQGNIQSKKTSNIVIPKQDVMHPILNSLNVVKERKFDPERKKISVISDILVKPLENYPVWLKDSSPQADPFNIINTVNRQLKYITEDSKNHFVDVGVQNSFSREKPKSFSEHSGSDTSKNIPSLDSDINSKCIKHLEVPKTNLNSNINKKQFTEEYSTNFNEESKKLGSDIDMIRHNLFLDDEELDEERMKKCRESVITISPNVSLNKNKKYCSKTQTQFVESPKDRSKTSQTLTTQTQAVESPRDASGSIIDVLNIGFEDSESKTQVVSENTSEFRSLGSFRPSTDRENSVSQINIGFLDDIPDLKIPNTNLKVLEKTESVSDIPKSDRELLKELESNISSTSMKHQKYRSSENIVSNVSKSTQNSKISTEYSDSMKSSTDLKSESVQKQKKNISSSKTDDISAKRPNKTSTQKTPEMSSEEIFSEHSKKCTNSNSDQNNSKIRKLNSSSTDFDKVATLSIKIETEKAGIDKNNIMKNICVRSKANHEKVALMKNISVRSNDTSLKDLNTTQNEIHLKFEAEIHLLNDFNQSLRQFSEIEKEFNCLRSKNDSDKTAKNALQDCGTQTSKSINQSKSQSKSLDLDFDVSKSQLSFINFTRGTSRYKDVTIKDYQNGDLSQDISEVDSTINSVVSLRESSVSQILSLEASESNTVGYSKYIKNGSVIGVAGISLMLFDQMLKEEDARLENLKINLEIRKKALLDRTKLELFSLNDQKRKLQKNQKLEEASEIRKRQRGILMRLQQERHEIHKIKQMQNEASQKRKIEIKQQRKLIKNQLLTDATSGSLRVKPRERRRYSEPLRVIQTTATSLNEPVQSDNEIQSITKSKTVSTVPSEPSDHSSTAASDILQLEVASLKSNSSVALAERTLLMRQQALDKRRKAAEELLQWHKKLVEEEKAVTNLEEQAKNIVFQTPSEANKNRRLTHLKRNLSENDVKTISQDVVLQSFKTFSSPSQVSFTTDQKSNNINNYSTEFEPESVEDEVDETQITSINDLIDNFSKIQEEISTIQSEKSMEDEIENEITRIDNVESELTDANQVFDINAVQTNAEVEKSSNIKNVPKLISDSDLKSIENYKEVVSENHESKKDSESNNIIVIESDNVIEEEKQEENITLLELNLDLQETQNTSLSSDGDQDSGTSKQIEDLTEELVTPLSKEVRTSFIEEKEHDSFSSQSENQKVPSVVLVEDQSLENKTDEEKAASILSYSYQNESESPRRFTLSEEYAAQLNASSNSNNNSHLIVPSSEQTQSSSISTEESSTESVKSPKMMCSTEALSPRLKDRTITESPKNEVPKAVNVDVKKRVLEILGETRGGGSKTSKMQDLYVLTYDLTSPEAGPSKESLGNEAQELLRKQLAIEQEIKLLTAQQQKEAVPITFVREIPNKPPPPYKPPVTKSLKKSVIDTVIPKPKEIEEIASYSAKIIHKAYLTNNLENTNISDNILNLISKDINKDCYKFVFDMCKEIAIEHYNQFKKQHDLMSFDVGTLCLSKSKPLDVQGLEKLLKIKLMESLNYQKPTVRHSSIISWSKEKIKDQVEAVIIEELSAEENTWNNYEKQEVLVKNKVLDQVFQKLFDDALKDVMKSFETKYSSK